ncbi:long-chain-fatty-acid--CoA ligase [Lentibacillus sp. N15]|uniref:class I adenylate-forming enzyme family protein n=1 Tax=Lentibacillus songyuanensis TaxID=3136161 RepID=UPI0031BAD0A5
MKTIHGMLENNAKKHPNKDALITATVRMSYPELNAKVNQIARCLQESGVQKGNRIAIISTNNEHFFFAYFSLLKIGAIPMPVNVKLTSPEIHAILTNVDADGIIFEHEFNTTINTILETWSSALVFTIKQLLDQSRIQDQTNLNLPIDTNDICEILFTSGTTGVPKGVVFSHKNVLTLTQAIATEFNFTAKDKALTIMPLSHSAPLNNFTLAPIYAGASVVVDNFTPQAFLQWIDDEKTTFTFVAPVAYLLTAKQENMNDYDLSSMRVFAYGGSAMPLATFNYVTKRFANKNFYQVYGLTEAGPNGSLLRPHEHITKSGSIGNKPVINMELKIVAEDGKETAPNEYGEILLKGDSVMAGYYNNPEATANAIKDGWLYTGDIAYKDEDDYMYIIDRKKDVIIPGGVNVYPREIEEVLTNHPAIYQACVVGVPDEKWGETVKAVIVLKDDQLLTETELHEYLATYLADYKQPRIYRFVDELPHSASGKILKQQVKEM